MTITNGASHKTVEDLLSSIRASIGEDVGGNKLEFSAQPLRREAALAEGRAEFELPAIFKPEHQSSAVRPNIFGRLSDALKNNAPQDADTARTVIRFEPTGGRMIEPPAAPPAAEAARKDAVSEAVDRVEKENAPMKREMMTFFDTRLNRMGEMTRQANMPKAEPAPQSLTPQPPPLNAAPAVAEGGANGGLEDAAAQLLRPILKQWLTENMPKIVEKALRSETGMALPPPDGRNGKA